MYKIGDAVYKLCLFDTNTLSYIIRDKERFKKLFDKYPFPDYLYTYSPYVLYEIGKHRELFEKYIEFFSIFPSLLLKNEVELFIEEMKTTQGNYSPSIWAISPNSIIGEGSSKTKLKQLFSLVDIDKKFLALQKDIENNYTVMVEYAEWAKKYTDSTPKKVIAERIIEVFSANMIGSWLTNSGMVADIKAHLKNDIVNTISNAWYMKFVTDKKRNTDFNDVVDIYNISALKYCDVYIGERNMVDVISKMQQKRIHEGIIIEKASKYL